MMNYRMNEMRNFDTNLFRVNRLKGVKKKTEEKSRTVITIQKTVIMITKKKKQI